MTLQANDKLLKTDKDIMDKKITTAVQGSEEVHARSIAEVNCPRDGFDTAGMDKQFARVAALQEHIASFLSEVSAWGEKLTGFNRAIETGFEKATSAAQGMATESARRAV